MIEKTKKHYKKTMLPPILYVVVIAIVLVISSLMPYQKTTIIQDQEGLEQQMKQGQRIELALENIWYTGYKETFLGQNMAYYYVGEFQGSYIMFTLSEKEHEQVKEGEDYDLKATLRIHTRRLERVQKALIEDLKWNEKGMEETFVQGLFEEEEVASNISLVIFWCLVCTLVLVAIGICLQLRHLKKPEQSPYYKKRMRER